MAGFDRVTTNNPLPGRARLPGQVRSAYSRHLLSLSIFVAWVAIHASALIPISSTTLPVLNFRSSIIAGLPGGQKLPRPA
jgi:hypothetical protein